MLTLSHRVVQIIKSEEVSVAHKNGRVKVQCASVVLSFLVSFLVVDVRMLKTIHARVGFLLVGSAIVSFPTVSSGYYCS